MKKHLYFIPGMWASSKIFERIHLPKDNYQIHYLEWMMPLNNNESLDSYVLRFSKLITVSNPILIGVSFGGIIAQELYKIFPHAQIIIISSIKHQNELRPFLKFVKKNKLYIFYPASLINLLEKIMHQFAGKKTKKILVAYQRYLPVRNVSYTTWAIHHFLNWKATPIPNLTQIHGDADFILPIKYISQPIVIKKGNHAMILTKSNKISQKLSKIIQ